MDGSGGGGRSLPCLASAKWVSRIRSWSTNRYGCLSTIVLAYCYAFAAPGLVIGQELFYPAVFADWYGEGASLIPAYGELGIGYGEPRAGVLPEALITTLLTTLSFLELPRRHRRPLW